MTEADKANEGREIVLLPNGVDFLVAVNEGITELKSLRDQLSKEREEVRQLREEKENMHNAHCRMLDRRDRDLVKEREMRKELVETFEELLEDHKGGIFWLDFETRIQTLLKKATELDKNKER